jgi:TolB-like protein
MSEMSSPGKVVRFGEFEVDLQAGCLFKHGVKVRLREQVFIALSVLLEHAGEVVTREQLRRRLWPGDVFVDFELNLYTIIAKLREALGDSAENPRYIETLPKRGYRLLTVPSEDGSLASAPQRKIRVVVLPFLNVGGDPAEEYFGDAMVEEIITALCQVAPEHLAVIARTTSMHYKHGKKDVGHIARELGVDYIVEGSVIRDRKKLTTNIQLIQTADQTQVHARKYDARLGDIFEVSNRAALAIAASIGIAQEPEDKPVRSPVGAQVRRKPTEDLTAYREYIQARSFMSKLTVEGFVEAQRLLERSVERDPGFALAYDALAENNWYLGYLGYTPPRKAFSAGITQALRALEIDNTRAETHALLGQFHKTIEYNWPEVRREMTLALRLDPASPIVRQRYAVSDLMPNGRIGEAIAEIEHSLQLDPFSLMTQGWLGVMLVLARQWDRAFDQAHILLQLDPNVPWGHFILGVAYRAKQMYEEAITSLKMAMKVSGGMPFLIGWLGLTLGRSGKPAEARALLESLHAKAAHEYVPPTNFAFTYLGLAEMDSAFVWLDRAVEECDQLMMPIKSYAFFDPIRADPRFPALLRKMNLEP